MKVCVITVLLIVSNIIHAAPADDFVITIKTDNPGSGTDTEFIIYTNPTVTGSYNYNVDCNNDGIVEASAITGVYTCNYPVAGTYTIRIIDNSGSGNGFPAFSTNPASLPIGEKILAVEQWGTGIWESMLVAFSGTVNMVINATDSPNFSNVTSMKDMFFNASLANPDTSNWDTSAVTNMSRMFFNATAANPDTSNWNTSAVTNMSSIFWNAISATPDTSNWDTSAVTNMISMFSGATLANPDTSNWDISSVTNMGNIFFGVTLPTPSYDQMLIGFAAQNLHSSINFHAGNSQYCSSVAQAARASIIANYNWNITDGGVCPEIFQDSFESSVVVFKTSDAHFPFDFLDVKLLPEDDTPKLIATGVDSDNQANVKIYLRQFDGVLEIMQSQLLEDLRGKQVWSDGLWHEVIEQGLSEVELW